ncbi:hypothetical protein AB4Y45_40750 [Paraburkholderia sp. EG287A]|uniref:hypothetical protein n=1 Tax=Paraburkholderia sp. EG287A TaxID=3237012 RepID=UPI0034D261A5
MNDFGITTGPNDYLVLAVALRRRVIECLPADRGALLEEITRLLAFMEPVVSEDKYFDTHAALARLLISEDDPISALDHMEALLIRCGAFRTRPPCLEPVIGASLEQNLR